MPSYGTAAFASQMGTEKVSQKQQEREEYAHGKRVCGKCNKIFTLHTTAVAKGINYHNSGFAAMGINAVWMGRMNRMGAGMNGMSRMTSLPELIR